tara:strand:+ start:1017 stop:1235 length:219 start_codon:yes stop_codon:yes gene_type:complete
MSVRLSTDDINYLNEDELSLVFFVVQEHMGLDPVFIKSIKKKKIYETFLSLENQLSETGRNVFEEIKKKLFL